MKLLRVLKDENVALNRSQQAKTQEFNNSMAHPQKDHFRYLLKLIEYSTIFMSLAYPANPLSGTQYLFV